MEEHPVQQRIDGIVIDMVPESQAAYWVGRNDVTRIEACQKSGLHANIPYVRVWAGDVCLAEFCQHNIVGVYFAAQPVEPPLVMQIEAPAGGWPADHDPNDPCCTCDECIPF